MSTTDAPDPGSTSRKAPGLRITLDDIAAVLEEAARRAGQAAPSQSVAAAAPPSPETAELVQRLASLAGELRDVNNRLNQLKPSPPADQPTPG